MIIDCHQFYHFSSCCECAQAGSGTKTLQKLGIRLPDFTRATQLHLMSAVQTFYPARQPLLFFSFISMPRAYA